MKTYWNLDARERLALTEDAIKAIYVPREVAEAGLLIPRKPSLVAVPPKPDIEAPSGHNVFIVKGYKADDSYGKDFECAFASMEDAQKFIESKPMILENKYRSGSRPSCKIIEPCVKYDMQISSVIDEKAVEAYDKAMQEYNEATSINQEAESKYEREINAINAAAKKVWNNWRRIKERRAGLEQIMDTLGEFLVVSEGNANMAIKFLMKKAKHQEIYDALNEIDNEYVYDVDLFGGCIEQDNNPYRGIDDNLF